MPIITKLSSQKNQKRVNLFLDNKFAFGLTLNEVLKHNLAVGKNLTNLQVEQLFLSSQEEEIYQKTLNFLSFRPRSEKEIKDYLSKKLTKKKITDEQLIQSIKEKIISHLKDQKLVDDDAFTNWWLEQRLTFKPKGKIALRVELLKKGIDKEIIEQALLTIDNQQLVSLAKKLVEKKIRLYQCLPIFKLKQKLISFLLRRGFDFHLSKTIIDEMVKKA